MNPAWTGVLAIAVIGLVLLIALPNLIHLDNRDHWYEEGWQDCRQAHRHFGMTPDDMAVLKHLKICFKAYIKVKGLQRRGDVKRIDRTEDFDEFRHLVWEICESRKEEK